MLAFTFPGQGSQRPAMGREWLDHPSWELVDVASEVAGRDLARLVLDADQQELTSTFNAQLATFVISLVAVDAIERLGLAPTICAGHSLGEYTALMASGSVGFEDGVRLVTERGEAMHHAASENPGTMAAVLGLDDAGVEAACAEVDAEVWVVNYNAPGQVVIAGTEEAVAAAGRQAKVGGARKVIPLPVAGAFHTPLMAPALPRLRKALRETTFLLPEVPVVANVDARVHRGAGEWPSLLERQLCSPVRWRQTLMTLASLKAAYVVEVGPGGVLTGLTKRVLPGVRAISVATPADVEHLVTELAGTDHIPHGSDESSPHQGERLDTADRVVVSPATGVFEPGAGLVAPHPGRHSRLAEPGSTEAEDDESTGDGPPHAVRVGDALGSVGHHEVRTPFAGVLVAFLAHPGERVVAGQPVAWLRVAPSPA